MIDSAMVRKLASAARIDLAHEELDRIASQLTDILAQIAPIAEFADALEEGAARHDIATTYLFDHPQPLREDVAGADELHGTLSRFAPEVREGFFTVPRLPTHGGTAP